MRILRPSDERFWLKSGRNIPPSVGQHLGGNVVREFKRVLNDNARLEPHAGVDLFQRQRLALARRNSLFARLKFCAWIITKYEQKR